MAKRNGEKRGSKLMRRGNGRGTIYRKKDERGREYGPYFMKWAVRDPLTGETRRVTQSTKTDDLAAARDALNAKMKELGFDLTDEEARVDKLLAARRNLDNERIRLEREAAAREAAARLKAEQEAQREREENAVTFAEAFVLFTESERRPKSGPDTLRHYEGQYNRLVLWLGRVHPEIKRLRDFSQDHAEEFLKFIGDTYSNGTRNKYLVFLRMFWRVLRWNADAQLALDPWDGISTIVKTDEVVHEELTVEELTSIAAVINSGDPLPTSRDAGNAQHKAGNLRDVFSRNGESIRDELRLLFAIGIYTGQRLGDCASLEWGEVDLVKGTINVMPRKTAKRYRRRVIIPIHPTFRAILAEWHRRTASGPLMAHISDEYRRNPSTLSLRILTIMRKAGIKTHVDGDNGTRTRTAKGYHSLRHTFSSIMLNAGVSSAFVDAMLCHAKGTMTMRYFHEHAEALATAVATLPQLPVYALDEEAAKDAARHALPPSGTHSHAPTADATQAALDAFLATIESATNEQLRDALDRIEQTLATRAQEVK